jgi:hypothetical protein
MTSPTQAERERLNEVAPEMLAMLKEAAEQLDRYSLTGQPLAEKIRAVIAKATGTAQ